ncbi:DNA helicase-2/ATP-dependent DNA helicase PcrA [Ruminiclostridium sufflavum DSM 19573]|uniref:DNA helicase-2/ATP-dependent DNA helicase PcrA n=1 Tax=Ruminiclostridium sufflavum DSM 19573 TaxID=1121337 RepID=A0A318XRA6_9FIRM|nr:UvrD-helicase domain-containing protein [Ruminiclostridium sufflavum]PYG88984.1 DNA helicase-2/ATP-dependent DNA helicase PcrA [Ruminiclostridium sufflavum DSM 19573]
MDNYNEQFEIEKFNFNKVEQIIREQLEKELKTISSKKRELIIARRDMYENTIHSSNDFDKLSDAVQYLTPLEVKTNDYRLTDDRIKKYEKMLNAPYFARIDFKEEEYGVEKIYIGLGNLIDNKTHQIYVCDWRAPISSIFYRYGLGRASYKAPNGIIEGELLLKRQFDIKKGELKYFFDSDLTITDDMLKLALSHNASLKMKSIVETIQREQDIIIRDIENDILIVQGVAGSGKTSVALHRVAFLLYHGLTSNLNTNNIIMISPNTLFSKYIDNVLPELGEKNIKTLTLEEMLNDVFEDKLKIRNRNSSIDALISITDSEKKNLIKACTKFKMSKEFIVIIECFLDYYLRRIIRFRDIFYNGECIADRNLLKNELIRYSKTMPLEKCLTAIENRIMGRIHEMRRLRLAKLEEFISKYPEHSFEIKAYARLLSLKESSALQREVYKFTRIDAMQMYKELIKNKNLFYRVSNGIKLPENIDMILSHTNNSFSDACISYEDGMAVLLMKLKMSGCSLNNHIKQVVIDEAQDYYPLQYEIINKAFPGARYTIMGDINQSIEKEADLNLYDEIKAVLNRKKSLILNMKKSFRSSYEISCFSSYFANEAIEIESFDRHESKPEIIGSLDTSGMEKKIIEEISEYKIAGYESIAIICKSLCDSEKVYKSISSKTKAVLISNSSCEITSGIYILPIYMAKGLEFDAVLLYQANDNNYNSNDDKKLLYIACTRALHKLSLFYSGKISRLIPIASADGQRI